MTMTITEEEEQQLHSLPGYIVVYHGRKLKTDREAPHYHLYLQRDCRENEIRADLLKIPVISREYGLAPKTFWSITSKSNYNLKSYWDYVWDQYPLKKQRLICWNDSRPQMAIPDCIVVTVPIAEGPISEYRGRTVARKQKTSLEKQQLFLEYCQDYYESKPFKAKTEVAICKLLIKYCTAKGFTPEASLSTWARYAYFNLLSETDRSNSTRHLASKFADKFF